MDFLAWQTALIAAAASVPLLVLLYFLKLKRRQQPVTSTLLWKRAVQDLQVNAPFQKLRRNLLLLLQLLALAALLGALSRPVLRSVGGPGRRYVLLIDRSASMNALEGGSSRLEQAKRQATMLVDSLRRKVALGFQDASDQAMVIAFDSRAKVMCNLTSDKAQLRAAIEAIQPTDGGSSLAEAITVARAFAQAVGEAGQTRPPAEAGQLELFSDGNIADLAQVAVAEGELNFHSIGQAGSPGGGGQAGANLALVAMEARRSYEKADEVNVLATLANYGQAEAAAKVQLSVDGDIRSVREVRVPPRQQGAAGKPDRPGKLSLSFAFTHPGAGVAEVRHLTSDPLPCDDAAWAVLAPPKKLAALLVTAGNLPLSMALKACPLARLDVATPAEFDRLADPSARPPSEAPAAQARDLAGYDVIVLDGHSPAKLPRGQYLLFGRPPADVGITAEGMLKNQVPVDWRARHPVLQFVDLSDLFAARCWKMSVSRDVAVLAEFGEGPAILLARRHGSTLLVAGFDVNDTNWPFQSGLVMFCLNATGFLGSEAGEIARSNLKVGQPITVQLADGDLPQAPEGRPAELAGPGGLKRTLEADAGGAFRFPATDRAGLYALSVGEQPPSLFAVNLLDEDESNIAPQRQIVLSGQTIQAASEVVGRANLELWPYLVALALLLACVEWFVYNSRIRL